MLLLCYLQGKMLLTAGCAVTCTHQCFLCLLGCLLSTLMAIGGCVQALPDHHSRRQISETDRRNGNHINPTQTKIKSYIHLLYILNKNRRVSLFSPFISSMCQFDSLLFTGASWRPSATHTSLLRALNEQLVRTQLEFKICNRVDWHKGLISVNSRK